MPDALAAGPDVSFDFARLVEYRDVTPAERIERDPHERLIEVKLPISVRFQGLAGGEIEHLDFEIDGTPAGIRVESFAPATELASDAIAVETITKTIKERSLGATLSGTIPVPVGAVAAEVGPSVVRRHVEGERSDRKSETHAAEAADRRERHVRPGPGRVLQIQAVVADVVRRRARAGDHVRRAGRLAGRRRARLLHGPRPPAACCGWTSRPCSAR